MFPRVVTSRVDPEVRGSSPQVVTPLPTVRLAQPPVARHVQVFPGGLCKMKAPLTLRARVWRG